MVAALAVFLAVPLCMTAAFFAVSFLFSLPAYFSLRHSPAKADSRGIVTVDDAVRFLRGCGRSGWDVVAAAQALVNQKMEYSRRNNWDSAERAFARGMGYCLQQAEALKVILDALGFESRVVQSTKNLFPSKKIHGYETGGGISGHAWLEVSLDGETRYVCPGDSGNVPGTVHFKILGRVTAYRGILKVLGHGGSALCNTIWDTRDMRLLKKKEKKKKKE